MLVRRQICGIFTRGLIPHDPNSTDYDARWILAIYSDPRHRGDYMNQGRGKPVEKIGVAFFDNTTLYFHIGWFLDDSIMSGLRGLLC